MQQDIWTRFLKLAEGEVDDEQFRGMAKQTKLVEANEEVIIVGVTSKFVKDKLEEKYRELFEVLIERITGRFRRVEFTIVSRKKKADKQREWSGSPRLTGYLNPKYTFDSFVVGKSNEFAYAAAESVAKNPGTRYNPLFLYGGVGLGKTHLMQAVGHHGLESNKDASIAYISSERFTNELITSLREKNTESFRKKYRKVDLLLVDDVQFFSRKESTQEEFFHTFNELFIGGKQIVLSSDRPPKDMEGLEERLVSRFASGLVADIQKPDIELRIAILNKVAASFENRIPDEVIIYVAEKITDNIRALEATLTQIAVKASLSKWGVITPQKAEEVLKNLGAFNPGRITIDRVQKTVADYYGVSLQDMKSKKRTNIIVFPRQVAMYLSRELTDSSLESIGLAYGGRDHSTVHHAQDKIAGRIEENSRLKGEIQEIITMMKS